VAKKARSAAQKRATAKLIRFNKAKSKKKAAPRKRKSSAPRRKATKPRKSNKPKRKSSSVAKGTKGILGKIPLINNPTFKKAATGVGTATIGAAVLTLVAPQIANQPLVKPLLALAGGDIVGLAAQVFSQGGLSSLGIGGGGGNGGGQNPAFA